MTDLTKPSVLIVDDEVALRNILESVFRSAGYVVGCAANGVEGLKVFQQARWDVVIVDRAMPEMSGEEMAVKIKSTHPHVPLIMITGLTHLVTRPDLFSAMLAKPFPLAELVDLVGKTRAALDVRHPKCAIGHTFKEVTPRRAQNLAASLGLMTALLM